MQVKGTDEMNKDKLYTSVFVLIKENTMLLSKIIRNIESLYLNGKYTKEHAIKLLSSYKKAYINIKNKNDELIKIKQYGEQYIFTDEQYMAYISELSHVRELLINQSNKIENTLEGDKKRNVV